MGNVIGRRLFGGSAVNDARLEHCSASDFDLPHGAPELERRLPRSALGRPLESWSLDARGAERFFGGSTWFHPTSDRAAQQEILDALGLSWSALSVAATCRAKRLDPRAAVQARRFADAAQDGLQAAAVPAGAIRGEIAGIAAWHVTIRVNTIPLLQEEKLGWRIVRDDTVFDILAHDDEWLEDVAAQVVHGPRVVAPSFSVLLPDGWVGCGMGEGDLEGLAARVEREQPAFAAGLRTFPSPYCTASGTFVAVDLDPFHLAAFPVRLFVAEHMPLRAIADGGLDGVLSSVSGMALSPPVVRQRRAPAGMLSAFDFSARHSPDEVVRFAVLAGGPRVLHAALTTRRADAERDLPLLDAALDSVAFGETWVPGDPAEDPRPRPGERIGPYLRRVCLLPGEGCSVVGPFALLTWNYVGAGAWDWSVIEGPSSDTPARGAWRLDDTTDVPALIADVTATLRTALQLAPGEAAASARGAPVKGREVGRLAGEPDGRYLGRALALARDSGGELVVATADWAHRWPETWVDCSQGKVSITSNSPTALVGLSWRIRGDRDLDAIGEQLATAVRAQLEVPDTIPLAVWSRAARQARFEVAKGPLGPDELLRRVSGLIVSTKEDLEIARFETIGRSKPSYRATVRRPVVGTGFRVDWTSIDGVRRNAAAGSDSSDPEATLTSVTGTCRAALGLGEDKDPVVDTWLPPEPATPVFAREDRGAAIEGPLVWGLLSLIVVWSLLWPGLATLLVLGPLAWWLGLPAVVPIVAAAMAVLVVPFVKVRIERRLPLLEGERPRVLATLGSLVAWIAVAAGVMFVIRSSGALG